jgi:hypothetical protein
MASGVYIPQSQLSLEVNSSGARFYRITVVGLMDYTLLGYD